MKTIPNKTCSVPMTTDSKDKTATFADLLSFACNQPPQGGFDLVTIRARMKVIDICKATKKGGELKFEDSVHAVAQEAVKNARWGTVHKDITAFAEAFGV